MSVPASRARRPASSAAREDVNDIEPRAGLACEQAGALHRVGLDERRARRVPRAQTAAAVRVFAHRPLAQHPGSLDVLRMRADHAAVLGRRLAQAQQEPVVDVRQAEARAFAAAVVHEDLERRRAEFAGIARNAGELFFGRNDEVITEVDAGAGFGDFHDLVEQCFERIGRHQIRNEGGDAAERRGGGFRCRVLRHARARDVLAVAEMQMNVDYARQHGLARDIERCGGIDGGSRCQNGCDFLADDRHIRRDAVGLRQHHRPAPHHQIEPHCPSVPW